MIEKIIEKAKKENKKVYVYAHKFPDGDAVNSSCASVAYLKGKGVDAQYVVTREVRAYGQVVGNIPVTTSVEKGSISLILDTSTVDYVENNLFTNSTPNDIYIVDHHEKTNNSKCIEDELNIPNENVLRNSTASSTCEILTNELQPEELTPQIADMLTLGLLTDTAKLKFLKSDTLQNVAKLIQAGADYDRIVSLCTRKNILRNEVGLAKTFLNAQKFQIGNTFGIIMPLDNKQVDALNRTYGIRNVQKKIFKLSDIENCSFNCMFAENIPGKYDLEFRSTPTYGNFDVLELATSYNGGGHYNASGCTLKQEEGFDPASITSTIISQAQEKYSKQATQFESIQTSELDEKLASILQQTNRLTTGVTPEVLAQVDMLVKQGANYDYTFKEFKTYESFMLENEILSRVSKNRLFDRTPTVDISLSSKDLELLEQKYNAREDDILKTIDVFSNIDIRTAAITLPNGRKTQIDRAGKITTSEPIIQSNDKENISL